MLKEEKSDFLSAQNSTIDSNSSFKLLIPTDSFIFFSVCSIADRNPNPKLLERKHRISRGYLKNGITSNFQKEEATPRSPEHARFLNPTSFKF
ncbi:hypothetical protein MRB53_035294 [Persea americana]|uniref:Uncharacterized protein n=1 Tax=Persea americana TaxID=3435 RepID=A0ACC2K4E7_PERAE|nr:hypothetical protein MRB53_035294 [Persea americana]